MLAVVDQDQPRLRRYLERDKNEDQTPGSTSTRDAASRRGLVPGRDPGERALAAGLHLHLGFHLHLVFKLVEEDQPRLHLYLECDENEEQNLVLRPPVPPRRLAHHPLGMLGTER